MGKPEDDPRVRKAMVEIDKGLRAVVGEMKKHGALGCVFEPNGKVRFFGCSKK